MSYADAALGDRRADTLRRAHKTGKRAAPGPPFGKYLLWGSIFTGFAAGRGALYRLPPINHATNRMQAKPNTALAVAPQQDF